MLTKIPKSKTPLSEFISYQRALSRSCKDYEGYINSNSYWETCHKNSSGDEITNYTYLTSISHWYCYKDWDRWYTSKVRNEIKDSYKDSIKSEEYKILVEKKKFNSMPLL